MPGIFDADSKTLGIGGGVKEGIRPNLRQFALLIAINAFVGTMVGLERSVFPEMARERFDLESMTAIAAFLFSFGASKVLANLTAGGLADRFGRKRVLTAGWLIGIPVPIILVFAPGWGWVVGANVLLGLQQGFCWTMTVVLKIDLAGSRNRGMATALNEWAGYAGVALAAAGTGYLAQTFGGWQAPFLPGIFLALAGLGLSTFVHETRPAHQGAVDFGGAVRSFLSILRASIRKRAFFAVNQAGFATNLKDGMIWAIAPLYLANQGLSPGQIGTVAAVYPAVWGVLQLLTGPLSDSIGRKWVIFSGMLLQGAGLAMFVAAGGYGQLVGASALIGLGTALAYPTLLAAVSDQAEDGWRASAIGVYRLWRDSGYVIAGAVMSLVALHGGPGPFLGASVLCLLSGVLVAALLPAGRK
jgi:MFS family permease